MNVYFTPDSNGSAAANFKLKSILVEHVKEAQKLYEKLVELTRDVQNGESLIIH